MAQVRYAAKDASIAPAIPQPKKAIMKDNRLEVQEYIRKAAWQVREDVENGCIAILKADEEHIADEIWDEIFDACREDVKFRHIGRFELQDSYSFKYAHIFIFFKEDEHAERMENEVRNSMPKLCT